MGSVNPLSLLGCSLCYPVAVSLIPGRDRLRVTWRGPSLGCGHGCANSAAQLRPFPIRGIRPLLLSAETPPYVWRLPPDVSGRLDQKAKTTLQKQANQDDTLRSSSAHWMHLSTSSATLPGRKSDKNDITTRTPIFQNQAFSDKSILLDFHGLNGSGRCFLLHHHHCLHGCLPSLSLVVFIFNRVSSTECSFLIHLIF